MQKNKIAATFAIGALALAGGLTGCGKAPDEGGKDTKTEASASADSGKFKACMVSDQGGFDDKSFNESGMEGLQRAKKDLGIEIASAESKDPSDFKSNVDSLVSEKCNLIIGVGFMLNDAIRDAAKEHKDVHFALVDARLTENEKPIELENVKPLVFNTAEAAYLAGYVASALSTTGVVSTYGGIQLPSVAIFMDGYADGIEKYNQDNGKSVKLIGWNKADQNGSFVGNFEDQSKGKQLTEQQIAQGSDVIMPVAGPVGKGTLAAVKGKDNLMVIGVDSDWAEMYPESAAQIPTSVVKEIGQSVFDTVKESMEGKFTAEAYVGTLANKGVNIAPYHDFESKIPQDVKTKVDELRNDIASGKIKVESKNNP